MKKLIAAWLSGLTLGVSLSVSFLALKEDTYDWYIINCNSYIGSVRTAKEVKQGFYCLDKSVSVRKIEDDSVRFDLMVYEFKRLKSYLLDQDSSDAK